MTEISAIPAYMRRAGEFDPDPSMAALREQTGIARVPTPFGYHAWLVTRYADARQIPVRRATLQRRDPGRPLRCERQ